MSGFAKAFLTSDEYVAAKATGAQIACNALALQKQGQSKLIENSLLLSAVLGIPVGAAWHVIARDAVATTKKQQTLEAQAKLYRRSRRDIEDRLALGGAQL